MLPTLWILLSSQNFDLPSLRRSFPVSLPSDPSYETDAPLCETMQILWISSSLDYFDLTRPTSLASPPSRRCAPPLEMARKRDEICMDELVRQRLVGIQPVSDNDL